MVDEVLSFPQLQLSTGTIQYQSFSLSCSRTKVQVGFGGCGWFSWIRLIGPQGKGHVKNSTGTLSSSLFVWESPGVGPGSGPWWGRWSRDKLDASRGKGLEDPSGDSVPGKRPLIFLRSNLSCGDGQVFGVVYDTSRIARGCLETHGIGREPPGAWHWRTV